MHGFQGCCRKELTVDDIWQIAMELSLWLRTGLWRFGIQWHSPLVVIGAMNDEVPTDWL